MKGHTNNNNGNVADELKAARQYVDRLLDNGADVPVDDDDTSYELTLPDWYDDALFKRAQKHYHENVFAMFSGMMIGLISILSVPSVLRILMFTKGSGSPMTAYRRYLRTIFHTMSWYDEELKPGSRSWRSLAAVRQRHVSTSIKSSQADNGIVSQKDMALTQFGFIGFILMKPHMLGIQVTRANHEALVHFWRVIGHMIGIRDEYNLLTDSWATTRPRMQLMLTEIFQPSLSHTSKDFDRMADHMLSGLQCFSPFLNTPANVYFTKMLCGCTDYVYFGSDPLILEQLDGNADSAALFDGKPLHELNWYSRWRLWMFVSLHGYALNFSWIRWYMNLQIYVSKRIITWFPFLAIYSFGVRKAYVRILGE